MLDQNQIDLFIAPRFLLFSAAICIDSIRLCNREQSEPPLRIRLLSAAGGAIPASNGIPLYTEAIGDQDHAGTIIVLTSYEPEAVCTTPVLDWLQQQQHQGARMACIETAAYVFAAAKLFKLNKKPLQMAAHYEAAPSFHELFGDHIALEKLYSHDGSFYSSAGAMSTLDLMLNLIEELRGKTLAERIAYVFNHQRTADSARKPSTAEGAIARMDTRLGRMVTLMQASIGKPMALTRIYHQTGVESSTARRLFQRFFKQCPRDYYRYLRLQYARETLQNSGLRITQIAEMTGFSDSSAFSRAYRQVYGCAPASDRHFATLRQYAEREPPLKPEKPAHNANDS